MTELKTSIIVDLAGNLARNAKKYTNSLGNFSNKGQRYLRRLGKTASATGRLLDRAGNRYSALLTGAVGIGTGKMLISLERRFTRLGIQANKSADKMNALKKEIYSIANAPDIRIDPSEITAAIEAIVEKTGDLDFAQRNIRNIGVAIQATGSNGGAIGEIMAEFQKMGVVVEKDVLTALDTLNVQGKEGAFTLENLAALGPRVVTAYTSLGRGGVQAIREMGAALQVIRQGTGKSEMAATAFEAVLRTLSDKKKVAMLQKGGVQVFDIEELKKGREILRPINELMVDIVKKVKGKKTLLSTIFDAEAMRAFNAANSEYVRTGGVASMEKFMNVQADGTTTLNDSARAAKDAAGSIQMLSTAWKQFADDTLTGPLQDAADLLNKMGGETTGKIIKGLVVGGAGALVAGKLYKGASWLMGKRGKGGLAGAAGGMGGMPIPLPVYVVNKQMSLVGDALGGKPTGGKGGKVAAGKSLLKRFGGKALSAARYAGPVGLAAAAGYGTGSLIYNTTIKETNLADKIGYAVAKAMSALGSKEARIALEINSPDAKVKLSNRYRQRSRGVRVEIDSALNVGGSL